MHVENNTEHNKFVICQKYYSNNFGKFSGKSEKENIHSQTIVGKEDGIKNQVKGNKKRRWKAIT